MGVEKAVLGITDYILFGLMLLISAGIGVYFRFSGGKQKTTEEYLLAGKNMSITPVAFSLMATTISATAVVGFSTEMYAFGIGFLLVVVGYVVGVILSSFLFHPVYFSIGVSTAYEYLDLRFGKETRVICSIAFAGQMVLNTAVVLYGPALALSAVTNISTWVSVISIGGVCTFYCTVGGMKAVLWTDVFQAILMFICFITIVIKGTLDVGGVSNVFRIANEGGRLDLPGFETDVTIRCTQWNIFISGLAVSMSFFGGNQVHIQRLLTVKDLKTSRIALYVSLIMIIAFMLMNAYVGLILYANFAGCDPLSTEEITLPDQLLPYYVMKFLGHLPGLPGICICGIFSAALSTVSSVVNSLTAVMMEDIVKPLFAERCFSAKAMAFTAKFITFCFGIVCISLTFLVANFGNLIQAAMTVTSVVGGPILGIFLLGMLTTRTNQKGAIVGFLVSIAFASWVAFGASFNGPVPEFLPLSTDNCPLTNFTNTNTSEVIAQNSTHIFLGDSREIYFEISKTEWNYTSLAPQMSLQNETLNEDERYIFPLYKISFLWFLVVGTLSTLVVGYFSSLCFDAFIGESPKPSLKYLSPFLRYFMKEEDYETQRKKANVVDGIQLPEVPSCLQKEDNSL